MRSFFWLLLLAVVLVTLALVVRSGMLARKNPGQPINAAMRVAQADNQFPWSPRDLDLIAKNYPGTRDGESGLRYIVRQPGTGDATPKRGQVVTVNYEGRFLLDEIIFDTSKGREGPFNFRLGAGWDLGVADMKPGERRTLIVPYWLGYGDKGIRGRIPSRATLVFDIELLKFE
jgi:FKBP-type peptidyl-prolyl cis-trans isomerase